MKTIYLISYHRAISYGAFLQAYALQNCQVLNDYSPVFIDYKPKRFSYAEFVKVHGSFLHRLLVFLPAFIVKSKAFFLFKRFVKKYLRCTSKQYHTLKELQAEDFGEATFICGSDQIWDLRYDSSEKDYLAYYLAFCGGNKISYAASCGEMDFYANRDLPQYREVLEELGKFSAISVREETHAEQLNLCNPNLHARMVLDPTFLLSAEQWRKTYGQKKLSKGRYVLLYDLYRNKEIKEYAERLSKERGLSVINICDFLDFYKGGRNFLSVTPWKLLNLIDNSQSVITNSFHGCAFSLIFLKSIHVFMPATSQARILNLMHTFGLENRIVLDNQTLLEEMTEFGEISQNISTLKEEALSFLEKAVSNAE